jgi:hypothetical protein
MSKWLLLAISLFALVGSILCVSTYHLSGLDAVVVVGVPAVLCVLSVKYGL